MFITRCPTSAREGDEYGCDVTVADMEGRTFFVTLLEAPDFVEFDSASGQLRWTPQEGQSGTQHFSLIATEGLFETAQEFDVEVEAVNQPPRIMTSPPRCAEIGEDYIYEVFADDPEGYETNVVVVSGPAGMTAEGTRLRWTPTAGDRGRHEIEIEVRDHEGLTDTQRFALGVGGGMGSGSGTAAFTAPMAGITLTEDTILSGTASDPNFMFYEMTAVNVPNGIPQSIHIGDRPVNNAELGILPGTRLMNGLIEVELAVYDGECNATRTTVRYQLEGDAKVGNQQVEFTDIMVSTGNFQLNLTRAYDSRDLTSGDFGHGWRLLADSAEATENLPAGQDGWEAVVDMPEALPSYRLDNEEPRTIVLDLPRGKRAFAFVPHFEPSFDPRFIQFRYYDITENGNEIDCVGCERDLMFDSSNGGDIVSLDFRVFDPSNYTASLREGVGMDLNDREGVTEYRDGYGHSVDVTNTSLTHSTGVAIQYTRDGQGRITTATDPAGSRWEYVYDSVGDLVEVKYPDGTSDRFRYFQHYMVSYADGSGRIRSRTEYGSDGRIARQIGADGRVTEYQYDMGGRTVRATMPNGATSVQTFGDRGELLSDTDPAGNVTYYEHDDNGNTTATIDPTGVRVDREYDRNGSPTRTTYPSGVILDAAFGGPGGRLSTLTSSTGQSISMTYDHAGSATLVRTSDGREWASTIDARGNRTRLADPTGCATDYAYDDQGREIRRSDALGVVTTEYDALGRPVRITSPRGTEGLTYDARGRLISRVRTDGARESTEYDQRGDRIATAGPTGTVTMTYDAAGRVLSKTYPDGSRELTAYDVGGQVVASTDRLGGVTRYTYDVLGRRTDETRPDGSDKHFEFDVRGNLISETDGDGAETRFELDIHNRVTRRVDPLGGEWLTEYGAPLAEGLTEVFAEPGPTRLVDPLGNVTRQTYNDFGLLTSVRHPDDSTLAFEYDQNGQRTGSTDEEGRVTSWVYDCAGNVVSVDLPDGTTAEYGWVADMLASTTDPLGRTTEYRYADGGRLEEIELPMGQSRTFEYEGPFNTKVTDFDGSTLEHELDPQGRAVRTTYQRGTERETVERELNPAGLPTVIRDATGEYHVRYDRAGRVLRVDYPDGDFLAYEYANARTTAVVTPAGRVDYIYDLAGNLTRIQDADGNLTTLRYDDAHRHIATIHPSGAQDRTEYDSRGWPTEMVSLGPDGSVVTRQTLEHDRSGRITRATESGALGDSATSYTYDLVGRLVREQRTGDGAYDIRYEYDDASNRVAVTRDGQRSTYQYDDNDRLVAVSGAGADAMEWDDAGRLLRSGGTQYEYDARGRLAAVVRGSSTTRIGYDAFGQLRTVEKDGVVTRYLIDVTMGIPQVAEYTVGTETTRMLASPFGPMGSVGARRGHPIVDNHGTPRAFLGEDGTVQQTWLRTAFGQELEASGGAYLPVGFHGRPSIGDTGLTWMGARVYDPATGRFMSRDPVLPEVSDPRNLNTYTYAFAAPTNYTDPLGMMSLAEVKVTISTWCRNFAIWVGGILTAAWQRLQQMFQGLLNWLTRVGQWFNHYGQALVNQFSRLWQWLFHRGGGGTETFYRTMSPAHFRTLENTRRVTATGETFISPTQGFSESYNGVLVQFTCRSGTMQRLMEVGVRDNSNLVRTTYPDMPLVARGWHAISAFFKGEGLQINIGLGRGTALDIFNDAIVTFQRVGGAVP